MTAPQGQQQRAPTDQEAPREPSQRPGKRSGEGLKDVFNHIERDIRRNAGLPPLMPSDDKQR